jgi:hypothetical protein
MTRRTFFPLLCALAVSMGCALGGCATDRQAHDANPYHVEQTGNTEVHGEAGVSYGQSAH